MLLAASSLDANNGRKVSCPYLQENTSFPTSSKTGHDLAGYYLFQTSAYLATTFFVVLQVTLWQMQLPTFDKDVAKVVDAEQLSELPFAYIFVPVF